MLNLGILANSGISKAVTQWKATADYLTSNSLVYMGTFVNVTLIPAAFNDLKDLAANNSLDCVITNPAQYSFFERDYAFTRVATLVPLAGKVNPTPLSVFGGMIFSQAGSGINNITQLKGKTVFTADNSSLGGYLMQLGYLMDNHFDYTSLVYNFTNDQTLVIKYVLQNNGTIGFVRTGFLEDYAYENNLTMALFNILDEKPPTTDFPYSSTTSKFPEWPFAVAKGLDTYIAVEKILITLFSINSTTTAAKNGKYYRWSYPLNYNQISLLLNELGLFDTPLDTCLKKCGNGVCGMLGDDYGKCTCDHAYEGEWCDQLVDPSHLNLAYGNGPGLGITIITGILMFIVVGIFITTLVLHHQKEPLILASSPIFLYIILVAAMLGYVDVFLWFGEPTLVQCYASQLLFGISFTTLFGSLFAKTYRVWKIFKAADNFRIVRLHNKDILPQVAACVGIEISIFIIWFASSSVSIEVVRSPAALWDATITCYYERNDIFTYIFTLYYIILVGYGSFLSWNVRKVPNLLNESKYIAYCIYNLAVLGVISFVLLFLIELNPLARTIVRVIVLLLSLTLTVWILFFPKFYSIQRGYEASWNSTSASTTKRVSDTTTNITSHK
eukprot:TRINITY_DN1467_c0_g2_i9.p1 TRINITY_DN1467_c0_g2~~TRINITY_DN1467_c0_g2_i9.p1  ORF type:complete len:613 (-),score=82.13 TRINITY_DN1467_c0_g2_i9:985-2823(-)